MTAECAQIEQYANGQHAFATARVDAWHKLGHTHPTAMTAEEIMHESMLAGWGVQKWAIQTTVISDDGVTTVPVPGKYATVRTNPVTGALEPLGVVGEDYTVIQNEANADALNAIIDESGAHFETAGSLRGGRQIFVTLKLPTTMQIGGVDPVDLYLVGMNSHDGSLAQTFLVTMVRVVCANTQAAALRNFRSKFTIRHTSNAALHLADVRAGLDLTFAFGDAFQAEADRMIEAEYTDDQFTQLVNQLWIPAKEDASKRSVTISENRMQALAGLYRSSDTIDDKIRRTRWGAYQAVTEYVDHFSPIKAKEDKEGARALRTVTNGNVIGLKERAFALLSV